MNCTSWFDERQMGVPKIERTHVALTVTNLLYLEFLQHVLSHIDWFCIFADYECHLIEFYIQEDQYRPRFNTQFLESSLQIVRSERLDLIGEAFLGKRYFHYQAF